MGASAAVGLDATPVLEFAEHDLDFVALTLEGGMVLDGRLTVCL